MHISDKQHGAYGAYSWLTTPHSIKKCASRSIDGKYATLQGSRKKYDLAGESTHHNGKFVLCRQLLTPSLMPQSGRKHMVSCDIERHSYGALAGSIISASQFWEQASLSGGVWSDRSAAPLQMSRSGDSAQSSAAQPDRSSPHP